jgi:hypothetical protein
VKLASYDRVPRSFVQLSIPQRRFLHTQAYNPFMANHFQELECEVCGKAYRMAWDQPMQSSLIEVNPVAISHCPMGKPIRTVGVTRFEELLDGQWVFAEPYVHSTKFEAA